MNWGCVELTLLQSLVETGIDLAHVIASLPLLEQLSTFVAEQVLADPSKTGIEGLGYSSSLNGLYADLIVALVAVSVVVSMVAMVCFMATFWKVCTMYTLTRRQDA